MYEVVRQGARRNGSFSLHVILNLASFCHIEGKQYFARSSSSSLSVTSRIFYIHAPLFPSSFLQSLINMHPFPLPFLTPSLSTSSTPLPLYVVCFPLSPSSSKKYSIQFSSSSIPSLPASLLSSPSSSLSNTPRMS